MDTPGPVSQPLMGFAELADYLGWSKQRLSMRLKRHPEEFPKPIVRLALGPVWDTEQTILWFDINPPTV